MTYILFGLGLVALFFGGEYLVRGAVGIARRFRVPPLVIGMTIVGFGTSMPELLVSLEAALKGSPAIAMGNVVGSNIANILLILGISALLFPIAIPFLRVRRDLVIGVLVSLGLWLVILDGQLARIEGIGLLLGLAVFLWLCMRGPAEPEDDMPLPAVLPSVLMTIGGLIVLMIGARLLVDSASEIARAFGISEAVIGLTVVAVGTSLPELATSVTAALRRQSDIAVGNVIGSNIFNILAILGATSVIVPIPVEARFVTLDLPIALLAAVVLLALIALRGGLSRLTGVLLLGGYAGYLVIAGTAG